jgi:hypothetical protein
MAKRPALGRGLSALLEHSDNSREPVEESGQETSVGRLAGGSIALLALFSPEANLTSKHWMNSLRAFEPMALFSLLRLEKSALINTSSFQVNAGLEPHKLLN